MFARQTMQLMGADYAGDRTDARKDILNVRLVLAYVSDHARDCLSVRLIQGRKHIRCELFYRGDERAVTKEFDAGGCTRADEKPDLLPVLGDELPQRPHVLVGVVNACHPPASLLPLLWLSFPSSPTSGWVQRIRSCLVKNARLSRQRRTGRVPADLGVWSWQ